MYRTMFWHRWRKKWKNKQNLGTTHTLSSMASKLNFVLFLPVIWYYSETHNNIFTQKANPLKIHTRSLYLSHPKQTLAFFRLRFLSINFPSPLPTLELSSLGNPIIQSTVLLLCTTSQRFRYSETNYLLCFHGRSKLAEQVPPHPAPFNYLHP